MIDPCVVSSCFAAFARFTATSDDMIKAVNSIPAYIEHATHFFVVSPNVNHRELPNVVCGYSSWLERGWW